MTDQYTQPVVAVLGVGIVPPEQPVVRADDLGLVRGDGIFETMHVRGGSVWMLEEHLARLARSARRLDLDLPEESLLRTLVAQTLAAWPLDVEAALRVICTRGPEHDDGPVTVLATLNPVAESARQARFSGLSVRTAGLGVTADARMDSPVLLAGAKTLSYAVNMAAQRWAKSQGADDVLWVSADGYALEGPTSTLVWRRGRTLFTVPPERTGILAGTTARYLLDHAGSLGFDRAEEMIGPEQLGSCDGTWLTSSVRGLAAIHTLDGSPLPGDEEVTAGIRTLLGFG